jgi:hypothetical protein
MASSSLQQQCSFRRVYWDVHLFVYEITKIKWNSRQIAASHSGWSVLEDRNALLAKTRLVVFQVQEVVLNRCCG